MGNNENIGRNNRTIGGKWRTMRAKVTLDGTMTGTKRTMDGTMRTTGAKRRSIGNITLNNENKDHKNRKMGGTMQNNDRNKENIGWNNREQWEQREEQ